MIAIGSDHGGFDLKELIQKHLQEKGYEVKDFGCFDKSSVDYPDFGAAAARAVASGECDRGIVVCTTGIGISMVANKVKGIRAAAVSDCFTAQATREHNDSNILCLGERTVGPGLAMRIVDTWLDASFLGGRHQIRVDMISALEK